MTHTNLFKLFQIAFLGLFLIIGNVFAVGFHTADEILPGIFSTGNFSFNGSLSVGSGTNPEYPLDVTGDIRFVDFTSCGKLYTNAQGEVSCGVDETGNGTAAITGSGSANYVTIWNGTSTVTYDSGLYFDVSNNRLGIGNINPTYSLDVNGQVNSSGYCINGDCVTDWSTLNETQNLWFTYNGDSGSTSANTPTDTLTISGGTGITTSISGDTLTITSSVTDTDNQNLFETMNAPSGTNPVADSSTDTLNFAATGILTITGDSSTDTLTFDATEVDGSITNELQNLWETITADSGSTSANTQTDTLTISGGTGITTSISGDTLTINGNFTDTNAQTICGTGEYLDGDGNCVSLTSATIDGSGTVNQVAFWSDSDTLTGDTAFSVDSTNNIFVIGTATPDFTEVDNPLMLTQGGSGDLSFAIQDGTGRAHLRWNSYYDSTAGVYYAPQADGNSWLELSTDDIALRTAPGGTAGRNFTSWTDNFVGSSTRTALHNDTLYIDSTSMVTVDATLNVTTDGIYVGPQFGSSYFKLENYNDWGIPYIKTGGGNVWFEGGIQLGGTSGRSLNWDGTYITTGISPIETETSMHAARFYDWNNGLTYYADPGGTSEFNNLNLNGDLTVSGANIFIGDDGEIRDAGTNYLYTPDRFDSGTQIRAPIFYDRDNAGFYLNPASISELNGLDMNSNRITGVSDPINPQDAATKAYVDANAGGAGDYKALFSEVTFTSGTQTTVLNVNGPGKLYRAMTRLDSDDETCRIRILLDGVLYADDTYNGPPSGVDTYYLEKSTAALNAFGYLGGEFTEVSSLTGDSYLNNNIEFGSSMQITMQKTAGAFSWNDCDLWVEYSSS